MVSLGDTLYVNHELSHWERTLAKLPSDSSSHPSTNKPPQPQRPHAFSYPFFSSPETLEFLWPLFQATDLLKSRHAPKPVIYEPCPITTPDKIYASPPGRIWTILLVVNSSLLHHTELRTALARSGHFAELRSRPVDRDDQQSIVAEIVACSPTTLRTQSLGMEFLSLMSFLLGNVVSQLLSCQVLGPRAYKDSNICSEDLLDGSQPEDSMGALDHHGMAWELCCLGKEMGYSIGQKAEGRITRVGRLGEDWESRREVCHTTKNRSSIKDVSKYCLLLAI